MPSRAPVVAATALTTSPSSAGSMPPLVSHSATTSAPASAAPPPTPTATSGGHQPALGVPQPHPLGARLGGHPHHLNRVVRVGAVTVEEVLGVEEHPLALGGQVP